MSDESQSSGRGRSPLPARVFLAVGGAIAMLLLGAAGGLLIATPPESDAPPAPSAVDIGFAHDMTTHHEQAVTMATLARERAEHVAVRQLAFDIETSQRNQIGRMQGWLNVWGKTASSAGPPMQWMHGGGDGGEHHGGHGGGAHADTSQARMPGMASSEELQRLHALEGPAFDVEFLKLMLRHHEGGAPMAEYGAEHAGTAVVRNLAANMLGAQSNESELMRKMLADRGATPLPTPA